MNDDFLHNHPLLGHLSGDALLVFREQLSEVSFPKKHLITQEGQTEAYFYIVREGVQRSYFVHHDKEHTFQFTYPGDFTGVPESFLLQRPSRFYLEALSDTVCLRLPYSAFSELSEKHPELHQQLHLGLRHLLDQLVQRQMELQAFSAEERFQGFMQRSAHVFQLIPQRYIASYLNMRPETFSKLLNRVRFDG